MRISNHLFALALALVMPLCLLAQDVESEPNNGSSTADALTHNVSMTGSMGVCSPTDNSGEYFSLVNYPQGQMRIQSNMSNTGPVELEVTFHLRQQTTSIITSFTLTAGANGVPVQDGHTIPCHGGTGTYFISMANPSTEYCTNYTFTVNMLAPVFGADPEPNNGSGTAVLLPVGTPQDGQLNFYYGDNVDYYRIDLPSNGVLNLSFQAEHTGVSAESMTVTLRQGNNTNVITSWTIPVGATATPVQSDLSYPCAGNTTHYYLSLSSAVCGTSYRFSYAVTPPVFANDAEPNNTQFQTPWVNLNDSSVTGHMQFFWDASADGFRFNHPGGPLVWDISAEHVGSLEGTLYASFRNASFHTILWEPSVPVGADGESIRTVQTTVGNVPAQAIRVYFSTPNCGVSYQWHCSDTDNDGTCNAFDLCAGGPEPGTPCDDGDEDTENDLVTAACECVGTPIEPEFDCPLLEANIGDACDPGPGFINGVVTEACECVGEPTDCIHDLVIDFATDANGADISWSISPLAGGSPVCSGSGLPSDQSSVLEACCLPDGCYRLVVTDAGGDGISGGGYILRMLSGERIIDNRDNGAFVSESSLADGEGFCLPLGTDRPIASSCDRAYWVSGNFLVANENAAVSNMWNTTSSGDPLRANSGYEFWFFDPNGTDDYSFRKLRTHAVSDGFGDVGATRACHIQLNNWAVSQHLQDQVLYNVRIRGVVNGVALSEYGPACRVTLDAALAACPPTKLNDVVGHPNYSCGVTRTFGGPNSASNRIHAMAIAGASQYEFEFSNAAEGYLFNRLSNNVVRHLNWPASAGPPMVVGGIYQVRVRARKGAIWCAWGDRCDVTISGSAAPGTESMFMEKSIATLALWPNPNNGQQLWLALDGTAVGMGSAAIDLFDLSGKRVMTREVATQGDRLYTMLDLEGLAAGAYMVAVTVGDERFVQRLVVQP